MSAYTLRLCERCHVQTKRRPDGMVGSRCPICYAPTLAGDELSRLVANGVEVCAEDVEDSIRDVPPRRLLAVVVRRIGLVGTLQLLLDGTSTMRDLATGSDSPILISKAGWSGLTRLRSAIGDLLSRLQ